MDSNTIKKIYLPLFIGVLLTGCKEAQLKGEWMGSEKNFNTRTIVSLITAADKTYAAENIKVSALESSGNTGVFYVELGDKKYSRVQLESLLSNIKTWRETRNTTLTVNFNGLADAKDESERTLLSLLQKTGIEQKGSQSTSIDWAKAKISVYTQQLSVLGYTDPYSDLNNKVYCQLKVPLTSALKGLVIEKPFPYLSSASVPESVASTMSPTQLEDYINEENGIRRYVNIGLEIRGANYPHTTTFSDAFLSKFTKNESMLGHSAPMTYSQNAQEISFYYGVIPDAEVVKGLGDIGGLIHGKCESMIDKMSPEIAQKRTSAVQLTRIGTFSVNPAWKPEE